jgi:hypothetical protein
MAARLPAPDIASLYQLPLAEFTAARNAMAKAAGGASAAGVIKALEKPSVPAWAVNQLYWRERRVYDRLVRASERARAAHAQAIKGKRVDLRLVEKQHMDAVRDAADAAELILRRAGDPATPATLKAVLDTLQALPGPAEPGQLTKALAPIGFGAFGAIVKGAMGAKAIAEVVTFAPSRPKPDEAAEASRRLAEINARRLTALDGIFAKATRALVGARAALAKAEAARGRAEAALQHAQAAVDDRRAEVSRLEREAREADQERSALKTDRAR